jgi:hypothetical protein
VSAQSTHGRAWEPFAQPTQPIQVRLTSRVELAAWKSALATPVIAVTVILPLLIIVMGLLPVLFPRSTVRWAI